MISNTNGAQIRASIGVGELIKKKERTFKIGGGGVLFGGLPFLIVSFRSY